MDEMRLYLKDFGPINEAKINIGRINVVGGQNATGKSTTSKILYSFLRANSSRRQEITYGALVNKIKDESRFIQGYIHSHSEDSNVNFRDLLRKLSVNSDLDDIIDVFDEIKDRIDSVNILDDFKEEIYKRTDKIDDLISRVEKNQNPLYISIMRKLLKDEFSTTDFDGIFCIKGNFKDSPYGFTINFKDGDFNNDDIFQSKGWFLLNDVYYIDSYTLLDLNQKLGLDDSEHAKFLNKNLRKDADESGDLFDEEINKDSIKLEKEINELINGEFVFEKGELSYIPENGTPCLMKNTASGIKQIGIIQLLIANRKLKDNSFLIMDEPEVNLHPEWQVKFAGVLVLLVKSLNVSIYINTHSPIFIEAISAFSELYGLDDETNYFLAEEFEGSGFNNITQLSSSELYKIYENLGKPYDEIDKIRIRKDLSSI